MTLLEVGKLLANFGIGLGMLRQHVERPADDRRRGVFPGQNVVHHNVSQSSVAKSVVALLAHLHESGQKIIFLLHPHNPLIDKELINK